MPPAGHAGLAAGLRHRSARRRAECPARQRNRAFVQGHFQALDRGSRAQIGCLRLAMLALLLAFAIVQPAAAQSVLRDSETELLFKDISKPLIEAAGLRSDASGWPCWPCCWPSPSFSPPPRRVSCATAKPSFCSRTFPSP